MSIRLSTPLTVLSFVSLFGLYSCNKSDAPSNGNTGSSTATTIASPVTLDLFPAQNTTTGVRRLFLPLTQIGTIKQSLIVVFDTGSEGLVFSASSILTAAQIADTGIVINSPDSAIIDGITVTSAKVTITYGDPPATRTFSGNIAYTTIVMGDQAGTVTTERLPFVLVYKGVDNQTQASVPLDASSDGIAGIYSSGFTAADASGPVTTLSEVKSPFNYINYTNSVDAGFTLSALSSVGWTSAPSSVGSATAPLLTLGVTQATMAGYDYQLQRLDVGNLFDPDILGNITYNGTSVYNTNILFDTGTPEGMIIYNSNAGGSATLPSGESVQLTTAQGFVYNYTTDDAIFLTTAQSTGQQRSIFGIDFFLDNAYMLDYTEHLIGLKAE